jgi:hypothetical protein
VQRAGISSGQDKSIGALSLGHGGTDLGLSFVDRYDVFAGHMAATLGPYLILDHDRAHAHPLIGWTVCTTFFTSP